MEKINGICIGGKMYEAKPATVIEEKACWGCELAGFCKSMFMSPPCRIFKEPHIFRHSPELTERLNNSKTKEK